MLSKQDYEDWAWGRAMGDFFDGLDHANEMARIDRENRYHRHLSRQQYRRDWFYSHTGTKNLILSCALLEAIRHINPGHYLVVHEEKIFARIMLNAQYGYENRAKETAYNGFVDNDEDLAYLMKGIASLMYSNLQRDGMIQTLLEKPLAEYGRHQFGLMIGYTGLVDTVRLVLKDMAPNHPLLNERNLKEIHKIADSFMDKKVLWPAARDKAEDEVRRLLAPAPAKASKGILARLFS